MNQDEVPTQLGEAAKFILHPTDFTPGSDLAFAHALRLALNNKADLTLLHVSKSAEEEWIAFRAFVRHFNAGAC